jgi:osmotically-inducible protein OsmY
MSGHSPSGTGSPSISWREVETALHSDRFFYDEHVTVSVTNGVVRLDGIVHDYGDLRDAWRISRRVASVKRVDIELEVCCDFDNGP